MTWLHRSRQRWVLLCVAVLTPAGLATAQDAPALDGRLARELLLGTRETFDQAAVAALPAADREPLERYLQRRERLGGSSATASDTPAHDGRRSVERAIVSLSDRDGIEAVGREVASSLELATGAGRDLRGTLAEMDSAERYLRANRQTPAEPFLYAFIASRCRIAIELSADESAKERLARKYRTMLERLRNEADPLLRLLARDLDAMPSLVGDRAEHPRDYLPPG